MVSYGSTASDESVFGVGKPVVLGSYSRHKTIRKSVVSVSKFDSGKERK